MHNNASHGKISFASFQYLNFGGLPSWIFKSLEFFNGRWWRGVKKCVIVPYFAAIGQTVTEIAIIFLQYGGHLGFVMRVFGPPAKSINWRSLSLCKIWLESMQYIKLIVWIICMFLTSRVCLENAYSFTPQNCFWGIWPLNGGTYQRNPQRHILARFRVVWAIMRENPLTGLTCRWVPPKEV